MNTQPRKLLLRSRFPPGDLVVLTAAVRDLHKTHPGAFATDVRCLHPEIWQNNPHLSSIADTDREAECFDLNGDLVHQSNRFPGHYIYACILELSGLVGANIRVTEFRGDIYLSEQEKRMFSGTIPAILHEKPFWLLSAGGKYDYTIKWWHSSRYQEVVHHFKDRIQFVQVGANGDWHPSLDGVLDLRGKTTLRELIYLVYLSEGVLCPTTLLMHLAAAVETKAPMENRPCVVVAGGREPPHWEAYPAHQYIHTVGSLRCCQKGGCWRSRVSPLGDLSALDEPRNLCRDVVGGFARCMDAISVAEVVARIEYYCTGGVLTGVQQESR